MKKLSIFNLLGLILLLSQNKFNVVECTPELSSYWNSEDEFFSENNLIFPSSESENKPYHRLSDDLIPSLYILELQPLLEDGPYGARLTCPGEITIRANCAQSNNSITLHSLNITIIEESVTVTRNSDSININIISHAYDLEKQFYIINLEEFLEVGEEYDIKIEFISTINDGYTYGLYHTFYEDPNGNQRSLVAAHFEPTHARRMAPIFDEPHLKANWQMNIIREESYGSLANMDLNRADPVENMPGWVRDVYNELTKMSSYIVCIAVSDYTFVVTEEEVKYPTKIWAAPHLIDMGAGDYAAQISPQILEFYETYFGIDYTLPKIENIALHHFAISAMENWGLNTYRDVRLLWIEGESLYSDKSALCSVICHEVSHQWFGNIFTPTWWGDTWLKEGFASYFAPIGTDDICPEFNLKELMPTDLMHRAMQVDVSPTTHPMSDDAVLTPEDIMRHFDAITYQKGGCIVRMIEILQGEADFKTGLNTFLNAFNLANANADQYFDTVLSAEHRNLIEPFTTQSGYPLLRIQRDSESNLFTISQEKFYADIDDKDETDVSHWNVPIFVLVQGVSDPQVITLNEESQEYPDLVVGDDSWVLFNRDQIGYYRVLYDDNTYEQIKEDLNTNHDLFTSQTRGGLIDDYLNLAFGKYVELSKALDLTVFMGNERKIVVWKSLLINLDRTRRILSKTSLFYNFRNYMLSIIEPALNEINYEFDESDKEDVGNKIILRANLIDWACNLGSSSCINFAKNNFAAWMNNEENTGIVFPDNQAIIYCYAVANGNDQVWNFALEKYKSFNRYLIPETFRLNLIRSLACSKNSYRLNWLLSSALNENSEIRNEHKIIAIQAVSSNLPNLALNFVKTNYIQIIQRLGMNGLRAIITTISTHLTSQYELNDLERFLNENDLGELTEGAVGNVALNIKWIDEHYLNFKNWFEINHF